ncbi:hypothetical protein LR948_00415 [Roseivivax sp. GX 12232]|uniref:hypothetical protein n=1 Tax=Roseivivax sp. GX 12232 TaxID=2900547 RepID=UPI001E4ABF7F|nr:hypothetical protein [Roseivivax sp. GX 12232]MCE0503807.1 hypothetical protein [Roseivivax sp. GX 12232]
MTDEEEQIRALVRDWYLDLSDFAFDDMGRLPDRTEYAAFELWAFLENREDLLGLCETRFGREALVGWFLDEVHRQAAANTDAALPSARRAQG